MPVIVVLVIVLMDIVVILALLVILVAVALALHMYQLDPLASIAQQHTIAATGEATVQHRSVPTSVCIDTDTIHAMLVALVTSRLTPVVSRRITVRPALGAFCHAAIVIRD